MRLTDPEPSAQLPPWYRDDRSPTMILARVVTAYWALGWLILMPMAEIYQARLPNDIWACLGMMLGWLSLVHGCYQADCSANQ